MPVDSFPPKTLASTGITSMDKPLKPDFDKPTVSAAIEINIHSFKDKLNKLSIFILSLIPFAVPLLKTCNPKTYFTLRYFFNQ